MNKLSQSQQYTEMEEKNLFIKSRLIKHREVFRNFTHMHNNNTSQITAVERIIKYVIFYNSFDSSNLARLLKRHAGIDRHAF